MKFIGRTSTRLEEDYSLSDFILSGQLFMGGIGAGAFGTRFRDRERSPTSDSNLGAMQGTSTSRGLHTKMTELYFMH